MYCSILHCSRDHVGDHTLLNSLVRLNAVCSMSEMGQLQYARTQADSRASTCILNVTTFVGSCGASR